MWRASLRAAALSLWPDAEGEAPEADEEPLADVLELLPMALLLLPPLLDTGVDALELAGFDAPGVTGAVGL